MSLVERDLFKWFWDLPAWATALLVILAGPVMIFLIELYRSSKDGTRLPGGLSIFHWTTNWIGDPIFIAGVIACLTVYYGHVQVEESFWTSRGFSVACLVLGFALAIAFITMEEMNGSFPPGHKWNVNRVYHFFFFALVASQLISGLRIVGYGLVGGHDRGLALLTVLLSVGYIATFVIDGMGWNPWWDYLKGKHPDKTWYL